VEFIAFSQESIAIHDGKPSLGQPARWNASARGLCNLGRVCLFFFARRFSNPDFGNLLSALGLRARSRATLRWRQPLGSPLSGLQSALEASDLLAMWLLTYSAAVSVISLQRRYREGSQHS